MHISATTHIQLTRSKLLLWAWSRNTERVDHLKIAVPSCLNKRNKPSPQQHVK